MRMPWSKNRIRGLWRWVLAGWLIATGLIHLLEIASETVAMIMAIVAIAAGVLLLLDR